MSHNRPGAVSSGYERTSYREYVLGRKTPGHGRARLQARAGENDGRVEVRGTGLLKNLLPNVGRRGGVRGNDASVFSITYCFLSTFLWVRIPPSPRLHLLSIQWLAPLAIFYCQTTAKFWGLEGTNHDLWDAICRCIYCRNCNSRIQKCNARG